MRKDIDSLFEEGKAEEPMDVKKVVQMFLRKWYWFLLCGFLGFAGAYFYNKMTVQQYSVNTTILIPDKAGTMDMKDLFAGALLNQPKNNIYDQIEIINSYFTIHHTLSDLNWRTSWYKKELLNWKGIYRQEPFEVQESQDIINPEGIEIYVTPTSGDSYTVSVNGQLNHNNEISDVKFEEEGVFGRPFINKYFHFTLLKRANISGITDEHYYFVFNNLNNATLAYQKRLKAVLKDKKSDIIQCTIQGEEAVKEGEFLNQLIKVYIEGKMEVQNEAQRRTIDFINCQMKGISDSLNKAGTRFTEFRSKNNVIDLSVEGSLVMNNLRDIESERAKSQMQLNYFHNLLAYLNNSGDPSKMVSPSVVGIEDVSLNGLVVKLGELYTRRQVTSFSAKENNLTLMLIDKELVQTRDLLKENLRNLIDNATKTIGSMKERLDGMSSQLNKLPQKEQQMISIQRQYDLTNEIYTFLLQKRAETNIALASNIPDVQIIDIARPETAMQIGLPVKIILLIGFILGLIVPAGFIMLFNFFDDHIRSQEDVENNTELPILGNIMHSETHSDLVVSDNPKSNIAESFRVLRTNLQFMLTGPEGKVISIHSNNPGEGKSFNSVNIATILAMNNKKVLLVGGDMRRPRLHKIFDLLNEHGLSTYLIGYDTIEQIIIPTLVKNLSFMPSGPIPPNPAEILGKPEMKILLEEVRLRFDFVIVDNPPIALVTDGIIISQLSDLNVFILRYGVTHKNQLEVINQFAVNKRIDHLALVVNDIKTSAFGYTYYKYYQYEAYQYSYYADEDQGLKTRRKKRKRAKVKS